MIKETVEMKIRISESEVIQAEVDWQPGPADSEWRQRAPPGFPKRRKTPRQSQNLPVILANTPFKNFGTIRIMKPFECTSYLGMYHLILIVTKKRCCMKVFLGEAILMPPKL